MIEFWENEGGAYWPLDPSECDKHWFTISLPSFCIRCGTPKDEICNHCYHWTNHMEDENVDEYSCCLCGEYQIG